MATTEFNIRLEPIQTFFPEGRTVAAGPATSAGPDAGHSSEEMVHAALPAVVMVSSSAGTGSGFFISPQGVIVTNAHVVHGQHHATVLLSSGKSLEASAIYEDADRDLGLIKVAGRDFPYLKLADLGTVAPGLEVVAIGSPGVGTLELQNTVTKGVVSGVRQRETGTWIQTDTSINPGNSGGPLLNLRGQVVGVNTLKVVAEGYSGLNFALASSEVRQLVRSRFGIEIDDGPEHLPGGNEKLAPDIKLERVPVSCKSTPAGADIEIDGSFVGTTPSELMLLAGKHNLRITKRGFKAYERTLDLVPGSRISLEADMEAVEPK
jgi:serine protease Do